MRRQCPGHRLGFRKLEGRAQVRVEVPPERELDRVRDREVGLAERDALEQVEGVGRPDFGPRQPRPPAAPAVRGRRRGRNFAARRCAGRRGRPPTAAGDPARGRRRAGRSAGTRARSARGPCGPRRTTSPAAATWARFRATVARRRGGRPHGLELEAHAEPLGKAAGQLVFRAFGTGRALVVREGAVAGDDLEHALCADLLERARHARAGAGHQGHEEDRGYAEPAAESPPGRGGRSGFRVH